MSDQDRISPHSIKTISSRQVTRINRTRAASVCEPVLGHHIYVASFLEEVVFKRAAPIFELEVLVHLKQLPNGCVTRTLWNLNTWYKLNL